MARIEEVESDGDQRVLKVQFVDDESIVAWYPVFDSWLKGKKNMELGKKLCKNIVIAIEEGKMIKVDKEKRLDELTNYLDRFNLGH